MPFAPEVTSQTWEPPKELTVRARVPLNCGIGVISGAHAIVGDRVELGYRGDFRESDLKRGIPACYCSYSLTYRIAGLERKPYALAVENMADEKNREKWSARLSR